MTTTSTTTGAGPVDPVGVELLTTLRALKLGGLKDTLPERLTLARQRKMGHAAFLQMLLSDEVERRDSRSAMLRARAAGLDPSMRLETWEEPDDLTYDRMLLSDLTSLRFTGAAHAVLLLGPVGVGKSHLATALGHIAIRRLSARLLDGAASLPAFTLVTQPLPHPVPGRAALPQPITGPDPKPPLDDGLPPIAAGDPRSH